MCRLPHCHRYLFQLFAWVSAWYPSSISDQCIPNSYLSRSLPWTQTPADKRGSASVRNVQESLCDSASCCAPLWHLCRSGSFEKPCCGTVGGWGCGREKTVTFGSRMSNFQCLVDVPDQRRICHHPAGGALVGRCTWSYQEYWCTGGHRAVAAARTHLCLPSTQRKTSTRKRQEWQGRKEGWRKKIMQRKQKMDE